MPSRYAGNYNLRKKSATLALYDKNQRKKKAAKKRKSETTIVSRSSRILQLCSEAAREKPLKDTSSRNTTPDFVACSQDKIETCTTTSSDVIMLSESDDELCVEVDMIQEEGDSDVIVIENSGEAAIMEYEDSFSEVVASEVDETPSMEEDLQEETTHKSLINLTTESNDNNFLSESKPSAQGTANTEKKFQCVADDDILNRNSEKEEVEVVKTTNAINFMTPISDAVAEDAINFNLEQTHLPDSRLDAVPQAPSSEKTNVEGTNSPDSSPLEPRPEKSSIAESNLPESSPREPSPEKTSVVETKSPQSSPREPSPEKSCVKQSNSPQSSPREPSPDNTSVEETNKPELSPREPSLEKSIFEQTNSPESSPREPSLEKSSFEQTNSPQSSPREPSLEKSSFEQTNSPQSSPREPSPEKSCVQQSNSPQSSPREPSPDNMRVEETNKPELSPREPSLEKSSITESNLPESSPREPSPDKTSVEKTNKPELSPREPSLEKSIFEQTNSPESSPREPSLEKSSFEQTNSPQSSPREPSLEKSSFEQTNSPQSSPREPSPEKSCVQQSNSPQSSPREPSPDNMRVEETNKPELSPREPSPEKSSIKETNPPESSPQEPSPEKTSVEQSNSPQSSPRESSPEKSSVDQSNLPESSLVYLSDPVVLPHIYEEIIVFDDELLRIIQTQTENFDMEQDCDDSLLCNPPPCSSSSIDTDSSVKQQPSSCKKCSSICKCTILDSIYSRSKKPMVEDFDSDVAQDDSDVDPDYCVSETSHSDSESSTSGHDDQLDQREIQDLTTSKDSSVSEAVESASECTSNSDINSNQPVKTTPKSSLYVGVKVSTCNIEPNKKTCKRINYCFYCGKPNSHIARHIKNVHSEEPAVAQILAAEASVPMKERAQMFETLRKSGDCKHNQEVLLSGSGVLRPTRRKREATLPEDYVVCVYCKAFVYKRVLYIHLRTCRPKKEDKNNDVHPRYAAATAYVATHAKSAVSDEFRKEILERMQSDSIHEAIVGDSLLLRFGCLMYDTMEGVNTRIQQTRNNMREAGRLLLAVKKVDSSVKCFQDLLCVQKWDVLVSSVLALSKMDAGVTSSATPSLAIKVGYHLQKMSDLVLGDAIRASDERLEKIIQSFMKIRDLQWSNKVVKRARRNLQRKRLNRKDLIPITEDLKMMKKYINTHLEATHKKLKDGTAETEDWTFFSRLLLVKCVMFNFKRVGEISNFELSEYALKTKGELRDDVANGLTKSERFMATTMTRVETVGKCTKNVPLLLTEEMVEWIDTLIATRHTVGTISDKNLYVFANPQAYTTGYVNGYDSFRQISRDCGAKSHELIRSTKLRHHIATSSQIMDLNHYELEQLATFMGHTLDVHRNYYRLPDSTIQVAKMSLLLHAMDKNDMAKFAGKSIDEIELEDLPLVGDSEEDLSDNDIESDLSLAPQSQSQSSEPQPSTSTEFVPTVLQNDEVTNVADFTTGEDTYDFGSRMNTQRRNRGAKRSTPRQSAQRNTTPSPVAEIPDTSSIRSPDEVVVHTRAKRSRENYVLWSNQELAAIRRGFAGNFASLVRPKKADFEKFMKDEAAAMTRRNLKNVRDHVQTKITSLKNKQK